MPWSPTRSAPRPDHGATVRQESQKPVPISVPTITFRAPSDASDLTSATIRRDVSDTYVTFVTEMPFIKLTTLFGVKLSPFTVSVTPVAPRVTVLGVIPVTTGESVAGRRSR